MYPVEKTQKMPAAKGRKWPAMFLTPLNYSQIVSSATRTEILAEMVSLFAISTSLFLKTISLFRKLISLIHDLKFPDNFDAKVSKTYESTVRVGLFTHTHS